MKANRPGTAIARIRVRRTHHPRLAQQLARQLPAQGAVAAAVLMLLGSCAVVPEPAPAPPPPHPVPMVRYQPTAPVATGWQDMPITPGEWRWSREGAVSLARFGTPGATVLTLACRRTGGGAAVVTLAVAGTPADGSATPTLSIHAAAMARPLAAMVQAGTVAVSLDARDPLLDAMAFSRGRFAVEVQGMPPLALPSWPEVGRVIDDCR